MDKVASLPDVSSTVSYFKSIRLTSQPISNTFCVDDKGAEHLCSLSNDRNSKTGEHIYGELLASCAFLYIRFPNMKVGEKALEKLADEIRESHDAGKGGLPHQIMEAIAGFKSGTFFYPRIMPQDLREQEQAARPEGGKERLTQAERKKERAEYAAFVAKLVEANTEQDLFDAAKEQGVLKIAKRVANIISFKQMMDVGGFICHIFLFPMTPLTVNDQTVLQKQGAYMRVLHWVEFVAKTKILTAEGKNELLLCIDEAVKSDSNVVLTEPTLKQMRDQAAAAKAQRALTMKATADLVSQGKDVPSKNKNALMKLSGSNSIAVSRAIVTQFAIGSIKMTLLSSQIGQLVTGWDMANPINFKSLLLYVTGGDLNMAQYLGWMRAIIEKSKANDTLGDVLNRDVRDNRVSGADRPLDIKKLPTNMAGARVGAPVAIPGDQPEQARKYRVRHPAKHDAKEVKVEKALPAKPAK